MEDIDENESAARAAIAALAYMHWSTDDLWDEFILLTDEAWEGRETPEPITWARREAIGLALIGLGVTAAELERGQPDR